MRLLEPCLSTKACVLNAVGDPGTTGVAHAHQLRPERAVEGMTSLVDGG
jgi:hypothetical protein